MMASAAARHQNVPLLVEDFSIGLPFASSSTNLSRYRVFRISGSSISSIRTPQMTLVILLAFGCSAAASLKNDSKSFFCSVCSASSFGL
jgi:hypothetical protein